MLVRIILRRGYNVLTCSAPVSISGRLLTSAFVNFARTPLQ